MTEALDEISLYAQHPEKLLELMPELLRPQEYLSPKQAQARVTVALDKLFHVHNRLHDITLAHEGTIRKRWSKKTRVKRRDVLRKAWPGIPQCHAPEVSAFRAATGRSNAVLEQQRDDFMLHFLNLDDLTSEGGETFLSLLHFRSHLPPSAFAQHDSENLRFGIITAAVKRVYAHNCSLLCYGDRSTYGKMIKWTEDYDGGFCGIELEMRGDSMSVADGLLVFELQTKLLTILLSTVENILHDIDLTALQQVESLCAPIIPFSTDSDFGWESVARQNNLRPYLHPDGFSVSSLRALIDAQYDLTKDHLIELHTSPSYLAGQLQGYFDHRLESLACNSGPPRSLREERATSLMILDAYEEFAIWDLLKESVRVFQARYKRLHSSVAPGRKLSDEYEEPLKDILSLLAVLEARDKTQYSQTLAASPPFRDLFTIRYLDDHWGKNEVVGQPPRGDRLFSILITLLNEGDTIRWTLTRLYDELDMILSASPDQRDRITPRLAYHLAQRGNVSDAMLIIDRHRPAISVESLQETRARWTRLSKDYLGKLLTTTRNPIKIRTSLFPLDKFAYPKGPKTEAWAQGCEKVDQAMSVFRTEVEEEMRRMAGKKICDLVQSFIRPVLDEKEPWANFITKKGIKIAPAVSRDVLFTEIGYTPPVVECLPGKEKVKRRGEPSPGIPTDAANEKVPPPDPARTLSVVKMKVSARAFKTWRTIFRMASNGEVNQQRGSVPWSEILVAFSQIGFSVIKLRGSAWLFSTSDRSFTYHAPHPGPNLGFWRARELGRRLTRHFHWTGESFEQIEKEA
ncbi:hypothetical protein BJ138DRAFT_1055947 [Hygrophoropsis aurantiaca]|uniref:Uncharacterized protein n=1 Tax=Hygrophoropsis aurantiaca TaxID=72124 RepID=A0ACB8APM5_9AGAM|nr:hypothetical protein BJ138DRAFT_1055947 [Hygrophoropsis aurantiaca]